MRRPSDAPGLGWCTIPAPDTGRGCRRRRGPAGNPAIACRSALESKSDVATAGTRVGCVVVMVFLHLPGGTGVHQPDQLATRRGEKPSGSHHQMALEVMPVSRTLTWRRCCAELMIGDGLRPPNGECPAPASTSTKASQPTARESSRVVLQKCSQRVSAFDIGLTRSRQGGPGPTGNGPVVAKRRRLVSCDDSQWC